MNRLMIGIEMEGIAHLSEELVLDFFSNCGLDCDDDYLYQGDSKFEYFVIDRSNYAVFKEETNVEFFTTHVIDFLRTLNGDGKILVQEDDGSGQTDDEDILFTGKISAFLTHWDSMGEGEE